MTYIPLSLLLSLSFLLYTLQKKNVSFNIRTLVGLAGGVGLGILAHVCSNNPMPLKSSMVLQLADLMGSVYLHLLQMIVIPLIFTSMIDAIMKMGDTCGTFLRRLLAGSVSMLLGLTAVSAAIGLTVGQWFNLGAGLQLPEAAMSPKHQYDGIGAAIKDMLPSNPFASMADGNTVAIVIFALLLGIAGFYAYQKNKEEVLPFKQFIHAFFLVIKQLATMVISLTPYGVLAMITTMTATHGLETFYGLLSYVAAMYVAMAILLALHFSVLLFFKVNPIEYFKKAFVALLVAFSSRSSFATLTVSEETLKERLGLRQSVASFVPSIGATLGMNACAGIFPAILVVMAMTIQHQEITWQIVLMVMFVNAIASLGVSGIPGTAFVAAGVAFTLLGLPFSVILLVQAVDPIIDMGERDECEWRINHGGCFG